jgi:hypothetical protein
MNQENINLNTTSAIKKLVNENIIDGKFKELIKLANPSFDKDVSEYDLDLQLMLSEFTRIFNLEQLNYILTIYKPTMLNNTNIMLKKLMKVSSKLKTQFSKTYLDSYLSAISITDLLNNEIKNNFDEENNQSIEYRVQKIAFIAYKIEKEFQFRNWKLKQSRLNKNVLAQKLAKEKVQSFNNRIKKEKDLWNTFELDYQEYLKTLKEENKNIKEKNDEDKEIFYDLVKRKDVKTIEYLDEVIKSTISFKQYIESHPEVECANDFKILLNFYMSQFNFETANLKLIAGYIYYFRLLNITKMMLLIQQFGIECYYNNVDMSQILGEKLATTELADTSNLLYMNPENAMNILDNDINLFISQNDNLSEQQIFQFMFCTYLNIEKTWLEYDEKNQEALASKKIEKAIIKYINTDVDLVRKYYNDYATKVGYNKIKNHIIGKVIDFPSLGG